jgi:dTDP-4-dehydrorhamnose reductase
MNIRLWAGIECTVNRVGSQFFDQVVRTGHDRRDSDIGRIAALGIDKLRYPVLWERTEINGRNDWTWPRMRLKALRSAGIDPIVGLLHHGSGPEHTSLVDPAFPDKLSRYARRVAERFPWVKHYTPVNEPLTTARFAGLYGHWYPHGQSDAIFARALINQCRGIVQAMREIRAVNSDAELIQTEDLGKTFSTSKLKYQAEFENERRWLTFDLLCGHVDERHPMWSYLCSAGVFPGELYWFCENPCIPNTVGLNHYVTSDRYLDERLECFPTHCHGTNGREHYADVEAVRVAGEFDGGLEDRLREAWERFGLRIAITEAHLGNSDVAERICWLRDVWTAAEAAARTGVDICAVTAWAMFGSYDWNSLVTREDKHYEAGVFNVQYGLPQPTKLFGVLQELAGGGDPFRSLSADSGWWRSSSRICYRPNDANAEINAEIVRVPTPS